MFRNRYSTFLWFISLSTQIPFFSSDLKRSFSAQERRTEPGQYYRVPEVTIERVEKHVDVGGRKLHCRIYGEGRPTVVLVSGFGAVQDNWNPIVTDIAALTTVMTYDRAGYGESEIGDLPVHGKQTAIDLHVLLEKLDVPAPYLLVGHSYGGRIVRLFTSMYPDDMAGLILEDTSHEDVLEEQRKILSGRDLEILEGMTFGRKVKNPKTETDYTFITMEQLRNSGPLPQIPFTVLTAGDRTRAVPPMFSEEARKKMIALGMKLQKKLVDLIPGGKHIIVEGVGHGMHLEKPEKVIGPIIEMVKEIRSRERVQ